MPLPESGMTRPFYIMALASGMAALIYETIWIRWFKILFGSTAYAASATLAAFFAGLAVGAALFARISQRTNRPLQLYVMLELGIIVTALLTPFTVDVYDLLYPVLYSDLVGEFRLFVLAKFLLAFVAMLPTAILLGGTLPLMVRAFVGKDASLGREGNRLYAINTGGAVVGSALGGLVLPEHLGINGTYTVGMLMSLLAAAVAWSIAGRFHVPPPTKSGNEAVRLPRNLLLIAWASGFGTLAVEVLLMHALSQLFDSSVYSIGAILIVILTSLALGAAFVSHLSPRYSVHRILRIALLLEAVILLMLPWAINLLLNRFGAITSNLGNALMLSMVLGGPAFFVGGLVLPLTFRLAEGQAPGRRFGGLLAMNTFGGIVGSVVAGFFMLGLFGLWASMAVVGIAYALAAVWVSNSIRERLALAAATAVVFALVYVTPLDPWRQPPVLLLADEEVVDYAEGAHGVVSVIRRPRFNDNRIKINNHYTLSGSGARVAVERGGHLPLLLHAAPRRVAFIGSATGITAGAAVLHPVEQIDLIELVPEVQMLASAYFGPHNRDVYHDPRTRIIVEDGRNHLRATAETYDVIVADLFVPWRQGVGSMYSIDHFESVADRLADGGVFCQWLPIFQLRAPELDIILKTFAEVFTDATLWRGNFSGRLPRLAACAMKGPWTSSETIERRVQALAGSVDDKWVSDPRALWMLYAGPLKTVVATIASEINSDDFPVFEYLAGRSTHAARRRFLQNEWLEFSERLGMDHTYDDVTPWPNHGREAGHLFTEVSTLYLKNDQQPDNNTALTLRLRRKKLKAMLPKDLQKPDPTVSEMRSL